MSVAETVVEVTAFVGRVCDRTVLCEIDVDGSRFICVVMAINFNFGKCFGNGLTHSLLLLLSVVRKMQRVEGSVSRSLKTN